MTFLEGFSALAALSLSASTVSPEERSSRRRMLIASCNSCHDASVPLIPCRFLAK